MLKTKKAKKNKQNPAKKFILITLSLVVIASICIIYFNQSAELYPYVKNKKWGLMSKTGRVIFPPQYDGIKYFLDRKEMFSEGLCIVYVNKKYGYINRSGKLLTPLFDFADNFSEGRGLVSLDGKYGYIDKTGKIVIPLQFEYADSFSDTLALVRLNKKLGFIDKTGKFVIPPQFENARDFYKGLAIVYEYGKWGGYIDKNGKITYKVSWEELGF